MPNGPSSCQRLKVIEMFHILLRRTTLIAGSVMVALIPAVVGLIGLNCLRQMSRADQRLYDESTVPLPELSQIAVLLQRMRIASRDFIGAEGDPAGRMKFEEQLSSLAADLDRVEIRPPQAQMRTQHLRTTANVLLCQIVEIVHGRSDTVAPGSRLSIF